MQYGGNARPAEPRMSLSAAKLRMARAPFVATQRIAFLQYRPQICCI
jgi:hypothetical protein